QRALPVSGVELLPRQRGERLPWSNFEQHPVRLTYQLRDAFGELHRLADVSCPVTGIGRLLGGDPRAGYIRDEWNLWRVEFDGFHTLGKWSKNRIHHLRMEGVRRVQQPRVNCLGREPRTQSLDSFDRSG